LQDGSLLRVERSRISGCHLESRVEARTLAIVPATIQKSVAASPADTTNRGIQRKLPTDARY
jgi:hypothetical protein